MSWSSFAIPVISAAVAYFVLDASSLAARLSTWIRPDYVELTVSSPTPKLHEVELFVRGRRYVEQIHGEVEEAAARGKQMIEEHR